MTTNHPATKNLTHAALLALWVVAGLWITLKGLMGGSGAHLMAGVGYWIWFGGLAALTSVLVSRVESAVGALAIHALVFFGMTLMPSALPLSLIRLGLDLLRRA